jgi:hypothetical protein
MSAVIGSKIPGFSPCGYQDADLSAPSLTARVYGVEQAFMPAVMPTKEIGL